MAGNTSTDLAYQYSNANVIALDLNPMNIFSKSNRVVFLEKDIQEFVLEDSFDCVIGIAVLPYVKDKLRALLNIWQSLKLHGIAVLSVQPYYFGPYALEMFAYGDIKWDQDRKALVIHKSCNHLHQHKLPCLNYVYLEYTQKTIMQNGRVINAWPSFLRYPYRSHPYVKEPVEERPYEQAVVSLYIRNSVAIQEGLADYLFKVKALYPRIMVTEPQANNRHVEYHTFLRCSAGKLSPHNPTHADRLCAEKEEQMKISLNAAKKSPSTPSCREWLSACLYFWRTAAYDKMNSTEFDTEQYLHSDGNKLT